MNKNNKQSLIKSKWARTLTFLAVFIIVFLIYSSNPADVIGTIADRSPLPLHSKIMSYLSEEEDSSSDDVDETETAVIAVSDKSAKNIKTKVDRSGASAPAQIEPVAVEDVSSDDELLVMIPEMEGALSPSELTEGDDLDTRDDDMNDDILEENQNEDQEEVETDSDGDIEDDSDDSDDGEIVIIHRRGGGGDSNDDGDNNGNDNDDNEDDDGNNDDNSNDGEDNDDDKSLPPTSDNPTVDNPITDPTTASTATTVVDPTEPAVKDANGDDDSLPGDPVIPDSNDNPVDADKELPPVSEPPVADSVVDPIATSTTDPIVEPIDNDDNSLPDEPVAPDSNDNPVDNGKPLPPALPDTPIDNPVAGPVTATTATATNPNSPVDSGESGDPSGDIPTPLAKE